MSKEEIEELLRLNYELVYKRERVEAFREELSKKEKEVKLCELKLKNLMITVAKRNNHNEEKPK